MPFNPYLFNVKVADFESPVINRLSSSTIIDEAKTVHLLVSFKARSYDVLKQAGLLPEAVVAQIKNKICRYIFFMSGTLMNTVIIRTLMKSRKTSFRNSNLWYLLKQTRLICLSIDWPYTLRLTDLLRKTMMQRLKTF